MNNKKNKGVLIYKEHEVNGQKYTPKMCNIFYIDKELGEASITTRTDEISFSKEFQKRNSNFFSNKNILNVEGMEIVEPGNWDKVVNLVSYASSLLNMVDFTHQAVLCENDSVNTGKYRDFIDAITILLEVAKKEVSKHWNYLVDTEDLGPDNAA